MPKGYNTEKYWDEVANQISNRSDVQLIAGDDEPYYRYKRKLFLRLFDQIDFTNKTVLEIGSGPGGNLAFLSTKNCREITGVDVSAKMIEISKKLLAGKNIAVVKINGIDLPFDNNKFDIVFTSTVLQHNTDEIQLKELIQNICRVSANEVIIFERIEKKIKGHETNLGRPVEYYSLLFKPHGFILTETKFLKIQASYYVCGAIRKLFNKREKKEGEPISKISYIMEKIALPFTKLIDKILPSNRDLGMLHFKKTI